MEILKKKKKSSEKGKKSSENDQSTGHFQSFFSFLFFFPPTLNLKKNPINQLIKKFWPQVSNNIYWVDTKLKQLRLLTICNDPLSRKIPVSTIHSYLFISYCTGISVSDVKEPSDIAVDWVSNHIYWVDTKAKTIEVADYDGLS